MIGPIRTKVFVNMPTGMFWGNRCNKSEELHEASWIELPTFLTTISQVTCPAPFRSYKAPLRRGMWGRPSSGSPFPLSCSEGRVDLV